MGRVLAFEIATAANGACFLRAGMSPHREGTRAVNVLALCPGINVPPGQFLLEQPVKWKRFAGQAVRIVYDKEDPQPHLRAALAHDCEVDLFDAGNIEYAWVSYDDSRHRRFKRQHDITICEPVMHRMSWPWAYLMAKEYRAD